MAIKDQCSQCKLLDGYICKNSSSYPTYDQTSCTQYTKKGIDLDKKNEVITPISDVDVQQKTSQEGNVMSTTKQGMFRHPFSFKGRIRRSEYILTYLIINIFFLPINILPEDSISEGIAWFYILSIIPAYWFLLAQGAKRCHDRGNSGWYQIIPFYGLWMLFADGEEHVNEYGPDPKGRHINS